MSIHHSRAEVKAFLKDATSSYGALGVAELLAQVAKETSLDYYRRGNDGAIIHYHARELAECVTCMGGNVNREVEKG